MPKVFTLSAILKDLYCVHHFYCEMEDKLSISDFRKQEESEVAAQIPEQDSGMVSRELTSHQPEFCKEPSTSL